MAASLYSIEPDSKETQSQFQEIHDLVQDARNEGKTVLLTLDIDGVQDETRLEVEQRIKKYLENSDEFKKYIKKEIVPSVLALGAKLAPEQLSGVQKPLESLIEYLTSNPEDRRNVLEPLEHSGDAKIHPYYLSYCELLKLLSKINSPLSWENVMETIEKNILTNTALICAMHLSTAVCATSPLAVSDKRNNAKEHLVQLYRDFQHSTENSSYVIGLTSRTTAMAGTFAQALAIMLGENTANPVPLQSLQDQGLEYSYNSERFPLHPTSAIGGSSIIAASRNEKGMIMDELLRQNSTLLENPLCIIFVDDSTTALEDMEKLRQLRGVEEIGFTLKTVLFKRNRTVEEKQALCARVAENLGQEKLMKAIANYQDRARSTNNEDTAALAVMEHYIPVLCEREIITLENLATALNPTSKQSSTPKRTWSEANPNTHFSLKQQIETNSLPQPTVTYTPQLN